LPKIELIPTGGVEPTFQSIQSWFDAGVLCVGMGSQLFQKELINKGAFKEIESMIRDVVRIIGEIKKK
jgi:2-dehydro-3-deoxyphosphogluconate aldolase/(4S)-4-hydroxy-2-oxoglutarate aldolase